MQSLNITVIKDAIQQLVDDIYCAQFTEVEIIERYWSNLKG